MSEPITVACPTCDARMKAPPSSAGKAVTCPRCQERVPVPALELPDEQPRTPARPPVEPDEDKPVAALLWYAGAIRAMMNVLLYIVALGSAWLFIAGLGSGNAAVGITVAVLAMAQALLGLFGAHLLEQFAVVFVNLARDARVIRQRLGKR